MDIKSIREYMGADWTAVQERIGSALRSDINLLNATNESILSHSGKQMRPLLSLIMARACSGGREASDATVRYAAASELLHNATLLHDDVADDSDQRRGVPTIMSLMGPAVSVLVGDYWLVKAVELVLDASDGDMRVIRLFSKTLSDLAEGEMLQLQKAQSCDTDIQDYLRIIYNKTASLFEAACVSAAISVDACPEYEKAAKDYAVALGLAFQIKDDILDYAGTESVGKPLGVDILEQKMTMPLLGAFVNAGPSEEERIRVVVRNIVDHPEGRNEIVSFVKDNGGLEYAVDQLDKYVAQAVEALKVLPESKEKEMLVELAYFTARRAM
ncbi:MAG: polyprenyl synthetase family protein [Bacteroidales bacterium]|nr:polyprenyl synthetase family protein [Bacteroidales bacterium]